MSLRSLARCLKELDPTGKFLGDGRETVVFRAPHAKGFMELNCETVDSGVQASDGKISITRYVEVTRNPPWFSFLHSLNRATEDLTKLRKVLDSNSWTSVDRFWEMLEYVCHTSGLKGLRDHVTLSFDGYKGLFSALLEPSEWEDVKDIVARRRKDVIYRMLRDLSIRDSMALLLRLYKLLLDEQFVLGITMSWREGLIWAIFWASFLFPGLPDILSGILWGAGGLLNLGLSLHGMKPSAREGLPESLAALESARGLSTAVQEIHSRKESLDDAAAGLLDSLLRRYQSLDIEDRRDFVKKMTTEISLTVMRYLLLYFQGCTIYYSFDNPKCTPAGQRTAKPSSRLFNELRNRLGNVLNKIGKEDLRYSEMDGLAIDLAIEACKLAEEYAIGPGMIQILEEFLKRSLEADLFLTSM